MALVILTISSAVPVGAGWSGRERDVAVTDVLVDPSEPLVGQESMVSVTVANQGSSSVIVSVKLSVNGSEIDREFVFLRSEEVKTVSFDWTPQAAGTYELVGEVGLIFGEEENLTNNRASTTVEVFEELPTELEPAEDLSENEGLPIEPEESTENLGTEEPPTEPGAEELAENQAPYDNLAHLEQDSDQSLSPVGEYAGSGGNPLIVLYEDGFDTYDVGTFPPGWGCVYSGRGWSYAVVDNSEFFSPPNSFKLEGEYGWAQVVGRQIPYPPDPSIAYDYSEGLSSSEYARSVAWLEENPQIWFEARVMTAEAPPGTPWKGTTSLASVGFYKVLPLWGRSYGGVGFHYSPTEGYTIAGRIPYEPHRWYHVRVETDLESRTYKAWVDGELLAEGPVDPSEYPEMLALCANNMQDYCLAWFDDVRIGYGPPVVDTTPPISSVNPIEPYWQVGAPFTVTASASDDLSGVENVELFYRYSIDNFTWEPWTSFRVDTVAPWSWSFDASEGDGYYEFYSVATDVEGNVERAPIKADARCAYISAEKWAPYLKFSGGEKYLPCSFYFDSDWNLSNNPRNYEEWEGVPRYYTYVHVLDNEDRVVIQYWIYFAAECLFEERIAHDWELVLPTFRKDDLSQPIEVGLSRRGSHVTFESYESFEKWGETNPIVYMCEGWHVPYRTKPPSYEATWEFYAETDELGFLGKVTARTRWNNLYPSIEMGDFWDYNGTYLNYGSFNVYLVNKCTGVHERKEIVVDFRFVWFPEPLYPYCTGYYEPIKDTIMFCKVEAEIIQREIEPIELWAWTLPEVFPPPSCEPMVEPMVTPWGWTEPEMPPVLTLPSPEYWWPYEFNGQGVAPWHQRLWTEIETSSSALQIFTQGSWVDLHIYDSQGRHVGINYENWWVEEEIPGSSFGIFELNQYVTILDPIEDNYRVEVFGLENSGVYTLAIRHFENGSTVYEEISRDIPIRWAQRNVYVLNPWESPRVLKNKCLENLMSAYLEGYDERIRHVITYVERSLENLWVDDWHIAPLPDGVLVFIYEYVAVRKSLRGIKELEDQQFPRSSEEVFSATAPEAYEFTIANLVEADKLIAETAIEEAKMLNDSSSRFIFDLLLFMAERKFDKGLKMVSEDKPDKAIVAFAWAWVYAQRAIEWA